MVLLVVNPSHEDERSTQDARTRRQPSPIPRTSHSPIPARTVNLPPELIRLVVLQVTRTPDLASFALTSRYLNNIAMPLLYSTLCFGPTAYRLYKLPRRNRGSSGHGYVSISAESPMSRDEVGSEDDFFDNRSSLCAELLSNSLHLLPYVRSISTNISVPNYAAAASNVRHLALGGVNDQHLLDLNAARHLKLTALELDVPPAALPELFNLSSFLQRQRHITHFASRNLADIKGLKDHDLPRLAHIDVPAVLACQLAPGRPITTARIFPSNPRRGSGLRSADELLMAIHALSQSTDSIGVTDLDVSVLWYGDRRMEDDCRVFFAAIRDSLQQLRHLRVTLWSDLAPSNVDLLFDCILSALPSLQFLETFEIRTWAEYGISHPCHLSHPARRAIFDLWKELCPSLNKVAALDSHTWTWHAAKAITQPPAPVRSNSDPHTKPPARRPLPPRPRPASGNWVRLSDRWDWQPTPSPLSQPMLPSGIPSASQTSFHGLMTPRPDSRPRSASPGGTHDSRAEGTWVQESRKQPCHDSKMWHSDLPVLGSTYQRNELDEHYVRIAHTPHIEFATRDRHRLSIF
ncbi:glycoside hydrolase family 43 protein [Rhizoctonia solani]|uniref:Glycoside hydrolase family 43 protein n=1 Tax=Rhizoctonia solani TaxID=456999 RepID=A0A8H8P608_9AGAM|nr:glycoside hydrolase family 43 protein [Rhizoctonia solani]QRW24212.1 glycoside hydrolase family 43 protein [Rhizoctonia solani]